MTRWWKWLVAVGLLATLAGCARTNDSARLLDIDAQLQVDPASAIAPAHIAHGSSVT